MLKENVHARRTGEFVCKYCDLKGIIIINYYYIHHVCVMMDEGQQTSSNINKLLISDRPKAHD